MKSTIQDYWEERAKQYGGTLATSTEDIHLRELEISTLTQTLLALGPPENGNLLDVGCGDGYSAIQIAGAIAGISVLGVDYSENMVQIAKEQVGGHPELSDRVSFVVGDVRKLESVCHDQSYEIVVSDRCLINLDSADSQSRAIAEIARHTKAGGYYIAVENFMDGHENMNRARRSVGLPEIPVRWHNLYFQEKEFLLAVGPFFEVVEVKDFASTYYFATRIIYSKMCQMRGERPDYTHEIHRLAVHLPWVGQFSPIRMVLLRRLPGY